MFFSKPVPIADVLKEYCTCQGKASFYNTHKPIRCFRCGKYTYQQYLCEKRKQYHKRKRLIQKVKAIRMKGYEYGKHAYA